MEHNQESSAFTTINEELSGYTCPQCGYPMVVEGEIDVCYKCGWWQDRK